MLTRLREAFGDPLFVRSRHGIVPTVRALELAAPVKSLLSEAETLFQPQVFDPAAASFTLSIAATDYAQQAVIVPFLVRLRQEAPGIRLSVHPVKNEHLPLQLENGDIDLALVTPETVPPNSHSLRLFEESYVCAMRADHPAAKEPMTLARFCSYDHALVSLAGGGFWGVTDDSLARLGYERRVAFSVGSFLVLEQALQVSDLIAVVPERLVKDAATLKISEPPLDIPGFTKVAYWHDRTHRSAAHRWARKILKEVCERTNHCAAKRATKAPPSLSI